MLNSCPKCFGEGMIFNGRDYSKCKNCRGSGRAISFDPLNTEEYETNYTEQ